MTVHHPKNKSVFTLQEEHMYIDTKMSNNQHQFFLEQRFYLTVSVKSGMNISQVISFKELIHEQERTTPSHHS